MRVRDVTNPLPADGDYTRVGERVPQSLWYFNLYAYFSGQIIYSDVFASTFNVVFTFAPVIAVGVFDQDVSAETALRYPHIYADGPNNTHFTLRVCLWWYRTPLFRLALLSVVSGYDSK